MALRVSISLRVYDGINAHGCALPYVQAFVNERVPGLCSAFETNRLTAFQDPYAMQQITRQYGLSGVANLFTHI